MSNLLNFKLTLEDLLGPKVSAAVRQVQRLGSQVEQPHKLNVDTSGAERGLGGIGKLLGGLGLAFGAFEAFNFLKEILRLDLNSFCFFFDWIAHIGIALTLENHRIKNNWNSMML